MTKAELVSEIARKTGQDEAIVLQSVEALMKVIRESLINGENVYLRGFGSFIVKRRAQKIGRNITKNTFVVIPEHFVPAFKPVKTFVTKVKTNRRTVTNTASTMAGTGSTSKSTFNMTNAHTGAGKEIRMSLTTTTTTTGEKTGGGWSGLGKKAS